ncbi:MAG: hypothetical protein NC078_01035 [Ruminococcus sp.]|nr:hypothetical protein [Ruminococcus sp.]
MPKKSLERGKPQTPKNKAFPEKVPPKEASRKRRKIRRFPKKSPERGKRQEPKNIAFPEKLPERGKRQEPKNKAFPEKKSPEKASRCGV